MPHSPCPLGGTCLFPKGCEAAGHSTCNPQLYDATRVTHVRGVTRPARFVDLYAQELTEDQL